MNFSNILVFDNKNLCYPISNTQEEIADILNCSPVLCKVDDKWKAIGAISNVKKERDSTKHFGDIFIKDGYVKSSKIKVLYNSMQFDEFEIGDNKKLKNIFTYIKFVD